MQGSTGVPQRVLVVGGSSEIGGALARAWLRRGTKSFVITERTTGRAAELIETLSSGGADVRRVNLDVLEPATIAAAVDEIWSEGDVDVVVIAIGLLRDQEAIEEDPTQAWEVLTVNSTATIQVALEVARHFESQQHGLLVLLSSVAGQRGRRDNYVYGAGKAAVDVFAEGLQQRFATSPVRVLVVRPGYVHSNMSAGVKPAPFAVTVDRSSQEILRAVAAGKEVVWIPSLLAVFFFVFRLLPRRIWGRVVEAFR
jgi:decaprenylphospho-beta-D-erythro-pentofuranosid-2-ulose 2-reductase